MWLLVTDRQGYHWIAIYFDASCSFLVSSGIVSDAGVTFGSSVVADCCELLGASLAADVVPVFEDASDSALHQYTVLLSIFAY